MKVGFVSIIKEPWGGSEELWAAAAHELHQKGNTVIVSAIGTESIAPKIQLLRDRGIAFFFRRGYIKPGIPVQERIAKKIALFLKNRVSNPYKKFFQQKPDVVVYTGACDSLKDDPFFLGLIYSKNIPLIIINQVHTEYIKTFDSAEALVLLKAFRYAKRNLFVSDRNKTVMERFLCATIPNALVIRNPVNIEEIEPLPYPATGAVQLAMVANLLINHKGHDIAFEVLSSAFWKEKDWHLNVYGSGVDELYIKKLCSFYGLDSRVTFHGKVNDIKSVWRRSHLLLMPSRLEGMPLAIVEAMLCARPVLATDVAGHMEWITDEVSGFIAEGANTYSLDKTLRRAWLQQEDWEKMGRNAYATALNLYDAEPGKTLAAIIMHSIDVQPDD